ncbi:MAG TPA: hypothetical protein PK228_17490 [Saprospiraceae bacterium]|nr:hypothetical protein [Saprospiraceae bacterium]
MGQFTTISEVDRIAAMTDPVLRNLQITHSYHELSLEFSKRTRPCANWCTFATWASRQAGQTIRKEDLLRALENNLAAVPSLGETINDLIDRLLEKGARMDKHGIAELVWETVNPKAAMNRASDAVARGNQKVYAEIAREFARFLDACGNDNAYDADNIARFCNALKPGDPPDGQQYLKQAFNRYYEAFFEPDKKKKAEHILLANIEIGFHEQTRLQPEIAEGMEASVVDPRQFKDNLIRSLFPNQGWITALISLFRRYFNMPTPLDSAADKFATEARRRIRLFLTARLMELGFPKGVRLHLGKDLKANFPPDLKNLTNPDLIALLKKIDPTLDSLIDTGTVDWANLYDRLHFIADLFRCYQETSDLLSPPFDTPVAPVTTGK